MKKVSSPDPSFKNFSYLLVILVLIDVIESIDFTKPIDLIDCDLPDYFSPATVTAA